MPNWVKNRVKIKRDFDKIKQLVYSIRDNEENEFDFDKIVPRPKTMSVVSGGGIDKLAVQCAFNNKTQKEKEVIEEKLKSIEVCFYQNYYEKYLKTKHTKEEIEEERKDFEERLSKQGENDFDYVDYKSLGVSTLEELGNIYINNMLQYGCDTWYDWCCKNWGTKWNSCNACLVDENTYEFDTAWGTPIEVLVALSKQFPNTTIEVDYADEDIGANCGTYAVKNGKIIKDIDRSGDIDFCLKLQGYTEEDKKYFYEDNE